MSALIFVAVAVAWLVYLVPKALEHHDESLRSRTVATFSHTMRVLARREPDSGRTTRLVPGATAPVADARADALSDSRGDARPEPVRGAPVRGAGKAPRQKGLQQKAARVKKAGRRSAAARRRNVLIVLVLANAAVAGVAGYGLIAWPWQAAPAALLLGWLVACRLMVRRERSVRRSAPLHPVAVTPAPVMADEPVTYDLGAEIVPGDVLAEDTQSIPVVTAEVEGSWDPVNVPLPTYVSKPPAARRTVRTIDLDSTGVWSSGRSESDSALVAEADAAARDARAAEDERARRRATGS